jgi:YHS domain-containing protein
MQNDKAKFKNEFNGRVYRFADQLSAEQTL